MSNQKKKAYKGILSVLLAISMLVGISQGLTVGAEADQSAGITETSAVTLNSSVKREAGYREVSESYPAYGTGEAIYVSAGAALKNPVEKVLTEDGGILSDASEETLTWEFTAAEDGRYIIYAEYILTGSGVSDAVRSLALDGKLPFSEAGRIAFPRSFQDVGEITINTLGDEIRPSVAEKRERTIRALYDAGGFYAVPLEFFLQKGPHTLSLSYVSADIVFYGFHILPAAGVEQYSELFEGYQNVGETADIALTFQAEDSMQKRSDSSIRMESNSDPKAVPRALGYKKLNVVGGYRWREGNQSITFGFDVPKDGYYKLSFRFLQNWNDGLPSYRQIAIDGEVPCQELLAYCFPYDDEWQTETLHTDSEEMLFYLEAGNHTLTMTVMLGKLADIIQAVYDNILMVSDMVQSINKLTGGDADRNYDYEFFKNIPTLEGDLKLVSESLTDLADRLDQITVKNTSMSSNFRSMAAQMEKMRADPYSIAARVEQLTSAQTNLGTYYSNMQLLPLMLDEFSLTSPDQSIKARKANFFEKLYTSCYNFVLSFIKDYNGVSGTLDDESMVTQTINVWVARGTEWAETIKYLADAEFTPKTGILVNIHVVPSSQLNAGSANALLLSLISGDAPDVALGVTSSSPVEFAIRDAVCDLSEFDDFSNVKERFMEKNFVPFQYQDGVYALPETMNFTCLFYRKDIFEKYGYKLPDTWEDLYYGVLPQMYQNGMQFYMPQDFSIFLYQNNGSFYSEDGLTSALDSEAAYTAFKEYTELFTNYGSPASANFLTRFRTGEMPLGVGSFSFYIQLCTAAPELLGNWGIAPLPGIWEDGQINRSSGGLAAEADMILAKDEEKKSAAWEFLKWWSSTETQVTYSRELESSIGIEARWNSANREAFLALDWSKGDVEVIEEMWTWATETPVLLGSYYTTRYINNAFNSVVISGNLTVRDALEEAVEAINRELKSKQIEYGVSGND